MSGIKCLVENIEEFILKGVSIEEIAQHLNMPKELAESMVYDVEQMMIGTHEIDYSMVAEYEDIK